MLSLPPPSFRPLAALARFLGGPRMLRLLVPGLAVAFLMGPTVLSSGEAPQPENVREGAPAIVTPRTVPLAALASILQGKLPKPMNGQATKEADCMHPGQWKEGGCWMAVADERPPCDPPRGKRRSMWPHEGKCWMPVGPEVREPTSGTAEQPGMAAPR